MTHKQQQSFNNAAQIHRTNILKSLEHRLEVARAQGNASLIQQLEAEKSYYHR